VEPDGNVRVERRRTFAGVLHLLRRSGRTLSGRDTGSPSIHLVKHPSHCVQVVIVQSGHDPLSRVSILLREAPAPLRSAWCRAPALKRLPEDWAESPSGVCCQVWRLGPNRLFQLGVVYRSTRPRREADRLRLRSGHAHLRTARRRTPTLRIH
jgi:hypothetical protein